MVKLPHTCLKTFMFFFNLLFFICGAVLLGIGIWAMLGGDSFKKMVSSNDMIFNGLYIIIAVGAALFIFGFLGCWGSITENTCLLKGFFVAILIVFIVQVVGVILAVVYFPRVESAIVDSLDAYNSTSTKGKIITQAWDTLQATVGCCGYRNYSDWEATLPSSCCKRDVLSLEGSIHNVQECLNGNTMYMHTMACSVKFSNYVWTVGGVGIGFLLVELIAMILTCCLHQKIKGDSA